MGLEIGALVCVQTLWDAIMHDKILPQTFSNRLRLLIGSWNGQCVLGEMIL